MRTLIVGYGEVGKALHKVIGKAMTIDKWWGGSWDTKDVDILHICIPFDDDFVRSIKYWKKVGKLVIVHSTVPIGTCDKLGVVHSPIRGVHPHLAQGIKTFVKYFGGKRAMEGAIIFGKLGIKTRVYPKARTTEAIKLWDTTQYGKLIMLEKEIYKWCKKNRVDFKEVYQNANKDYNEGYTKLGMPQVVRPYLNHVEGPIGGHCVKENAILLGIKL